MNIKELILKEFINLFENKDHLIKKLDMNDEQKQEVMDYFKKFPHREKEIDWNRKDLTYDDFVSLMKKVSKTQKKKEINKSGLEAFEEGVDVITFPSLREYIVVAPLNHDVSKLLGSDKFSGRTGEWCISANKIYYWDKYIYKDRKVFLFFIAKNDKFVAEIEPNSLDYILYDMDDDIFDDVDLKDYIDRNENGIKKLEKFFSLYIQIIDAIKKQNKNELKKCLEKDLSVLKYNEKGKIFETAFEKKNKDITDMLFNSDILGEIIPFDISEIFTNNNKFAIGRLFNYLYTKGEKSKYSFYKYMFDFVDNLIENDYWNWLEKLTDKYDIEGVFGEYIFSSLIRKGNFEKLEEFIKRGAKPNEDDFRYMIVTGDVEKLEFLLKNFKYTSNQHPFLLQYAVFSFLRENIQKLNENMINILLKYENYKTPIGSGVILSIYQSVKNINTKKKKFLYNTIFRKNDDLLGNAVKNARSKDISGLSDILDKNLIDILDEYNQFKGIELNKLFENDIDIIEYFFSKSEYELEGMYTSSMRNQGDFTLNGLYRIGISTDKIIHFYKYLDSKGALDINNNKYIEVKNLLCKSLINADKKMLDFIFKNNLIDDVSVDEGDKYSSGVDNFASDVASIVKRSKYYSSEAKSNMSKDGFMEFLKNKHNILYNRFKEWVNE